MHKIQTYGTVKVIPNFSYYMLQPTFESQKNLTRLLPNKHSNMIQTL